MYLKDKPIKLFRDKGEKYRPVSLYLGNKKIAGYEYSEVTGESLSVSDTYNSDCSITINGLTIETGTGDKAPDNLYTLNSVSNFDLTTCGKNAFNSDNLYAIFAAKIIAFGSTPSTWLSYVTVDGRRCLRNGQVGITTNSVLHSSFKPNTQYYITLEVKKTDGTGTGVSIRANYTDGTGSYVSHVLDGWKKIEIITPVGKSVASITQLYSSVVTTFFNLDSMMICELPSDTNYVPYIGGTINFPHTLRSLPDGTKDYIVIDNVARTAKLYRHINEIILSGDSNWQSYGSNANYTGFYTSSSYPALAGQVFLTNTLLARCNRFRHSQQTVYDKSGNAYWLLAEGTNRVYLSIANSLTGINFADGGETKVPKFKAWLANNPIEIHHIATPTITTLPYTAVKQYYPQTNVYTNATVQPTLSGNFRMFSN